MALTKMKRFGDSKSIWVCQTCSSEFRTKKAASNHLEKCNEEKKPAGIATKKELATPNKMEKIFFHRVKQYNSENTFYDHFIEVGGQLMVIRWYNCHWEYKIYPLEHEVL